MKRVSSQIWIGVLCVLLGFGITYQIKSYSSFDNTKNTENSAEIAEELKTLKAQRDELQKKSEELLNQVQEYEKGKAKEDPATKKLYEEVEKGRLMLGETDVKGDGIEITITPKTLGIGNEIQPLTHTELLPIINELYFIGAEAVAINDIRITNYTGIRSSSGGRDIFIGKEKISPYKEIKITAIGDADRLLNGISFPGVFQTLSTLNYELPKYEKKTDLIIPKTNEVNDFKFAMKVEEEEK